MNQDQQLSNLGKLAEEMLRLQTQYTMQPNIGRMNAARTAKDSFFAELRAALAATQHEAPEYMHPITILTKEVKPEHWEPQQAAPRQGAEERMSVQFESKFSNMLQAAWMDGWGACRDSEFIGSEAMQDAFNRCDTLALCIAIDQSDDVALTATQKASPSHDILPEKHLAAMNALINFINNTGLNTEQAMCEAEGGFRTALREASSNGSDTVPVKRVLIHALSVALGNPEKLSALAGDTVEDSLVELAATKLVSQQERQWVGLTENDREAIRLNVGQEYCPYTAEAIEVKLREKNAGLLAADAQRPALKPLTDEQKRAMWHGAHSVHSSWSAYEWYAQGVEDSEAAHGIKEQA